MEAVVGREAVTIPAPGWAVDGYTPTAAVSPRTEEETAAAVRIASELRAAIVVWGAGTQIGVGAPPARYDLALSLAHLDRILRHDSGDLTATVEAGVTFASLESALSEHGQFLEADAPFPSRATIGGTFAGGVVGPRTSLLGPLRNLVIGTTVVTADGHTVRSGGRVVKNVTGYDLSKLYYRSYGTLAVLTQLQLRLAPRPARELCLAFRFADSTHAVRAAEGMRVIGLRPAALAVLSPEMGCVALGEMEGPAAWWTLVGWRGAQAEVEAARAAVVSNVENAREVRAYASSDADKVWEQVAAIQSGNPDGAPDGSTPTSQPGMSASPDGTSLRLAITLPPAEAGRLLEPMRTSVLEMGLWRGIVWQVDRGRIVLHVEAPALPEEFDRVIERLRDLAGSSGGFVVAERLPFAWKTSQRVWGAAPVHQPLLKRVKLALDPRRCLAPGRLPGEL
jgi:glycolate oxidase FAD binding subunit